MMLTIMYVHIMEVTVALLLVATAVQLFRCNQSFYQVAQVTQRASVTSSVASKRSIQTEQNSNSAANILHDYIGEFFIDEAMADELKEYKNVEVAKVKLVGQTKLSAAAINHDEEIDSEIEINSERSNIFNFDESLKVSPEKTFVEEDDDTVITVMGAGDTPKGSADEKVMSDKVVHAMLDEAKLVCAS